MTGQRGYNRNEQLRDKILRERGLTKEKKNNLVESAPKSEVKTSLARLVESHFDNTPIRTILKYYSISEVSRRTGVNRKTLTRWKKKLGVKRT